MISIEVPGEPVPWSAPMVTKRGITYSKKAMKAHANLVAWYAAKAMGKRRPLEGPVSLSITTYRAKGRPRSAAGRERAESGLVVPTTRPDASNLAKLAEDALSGVCYVDDSQVVDLRVYKRYSAEPRTYIEVKEWTP